MGADLYIEKITNAASKEWKPKFDEAVNRRNTTEKPGSKKYWKRKVDEYYDNMYPDDGYFRDSYNTTSVLQTLGISWWNDVGDLLDNNGNLKGQKLAKFIRMVKNAKQKLPTREELNKGYATVEDSGENSIEEWHKYYLEKKERLLVFLNGAINSKEPIHCSI